MRTGEDGRVKREDEATRFMANSEKRWVRFPNVAAVHDIRSARSFEAGQVRRLVIDCYDTGGEVVKPNHIPNFRGQAKKGCENRGVRSCLTRWLSL